MHTLFMHIYSPSILSVLVQIAESHVFSCEMPYAFIPLCLYYLKLIWPILYSDVDE